MKKTLSLFLGMMMAVAVVFTGCSTSQQSSGTTAALKDDAVVEIVCEDTTITLTKDDLLSREQVSIETTNIDSKGDVSEVRAKGISLSKILEENGFDLYSSSSVNMTASDGYVMNAPVTEYKDEDIYLLLSLNDEELEYPRSAIPGKRSMYWVSLLTKVEVLFGETSQGTTTGTSTLGNVTEIQMFAENVNSMTAQTLKDGSEEVSAYSLQEYFDAYLDGECADNLVMKASDGFEKTETKDVFLSAFVTFEGEDAPHYFSETMKPGMTVKQLEVAISNNTAVYFQTEKSLKELFNFVDMADADNYDFIASDGFTTTIPKEAIEYGKVYLEDGVLRTSFEGYDLSNVKGKGSVKNLSKIVVSQVKNETGDTEKTEDAFLTVTANGKSYPLTKDEILSLEQIEKTLSKTNSKGETTTGTYKGVHWSVLAEHLGISADATIKCVASDGYEVVLTSDIINDPDSLFALYENGEEIKSSENGYVWFAASENFTANNWAKYVVEVVVQ